LKQRQIEADLLNEHDQQPTMKELQQELSEIKALLKAQNKPH